MRRCAAIHYYYYNCRLELPGRKLHVLYNFPAEYLNTFFANYSQTSDKNKKNIKPEVIISKFS